MFTGFLVGRGGWRRPWMSAMSRSVYWTPYSIAGQFSLNNNPLFDHWRAGVFGVYSCLSFPYSPESFMWKDQEHPAAEPAAETLKLSADPWAFWFILQSQFLNCSQPAASRPKAKAKRSQISFLAQRKEGQSWPTDTTLSEALKPLGLKVEFSSIYEKSMIGTGSILRNETADIGPGDHASPDDLLEKQVSALASLRSHFDRLKIARPIKPQLREALAAIRTATGNDQIGEKVSSGGS